METQWSELVKTEKTVLAEKKCCLCLQLLLFHFLPGQILK